MHYTGTVWRPPYEAGSLLLEVTAGCTHHSCKFCTLYDDLPFRFRVSPLSDVEADLVEAQRDLHTPSRYLEAMLQGLPVQSPRVERVFLVGANPFVLSYDRLEGLALLIRQYFPQCKTIGCFARVTDITQKADRELEQLGRLGYDRLTIGVESGDGRALDFMNKGYPPEDIVTQSLRLDRAGIGYHYFYLCGISGAGRGAEGAAASARIFNRAHPQIIGSSMLTVFPNSALHREIQAGRWREAGEVEKLEELHTLIQTLDIPVWFAALGASNALHFQGNLPQERERLLRELEQARRSTDEGVLRRYRNNLPHL